MKLNNVRWFSKLLDNFKIEQGNEEIPSILPAVRQVISIDRPFVNHIGTTTAASGTSAVIPARSDQSFYICGGMLWVDTDTATATADIHVRATINGSSARIATLNSIVGQREYINFNFSIPIKCDVGTQVNLNVTALSSGNAACNLYGFYA